MSLGYARLHERGISFYLCPKGPRTTRCAARAARSYPPSSPPQRSGERGPQWTLRNEVPDRLSPSGMTISLALIIQEAAQLTRARGVLQLAEGFGFDLADAFAGYAELLANFFQRVVGVHADTKAHAQDAFFARR